MPRSLPTLIALVAGLLAREVAAQGLHGVTRPTRTLERQAAARQFLAAAGLSVAGGSPGTMPASSPSTLRPLALTGIAPPMVPRTARPLVLVTPSKSTPVSTGLNPPASGPVVTSKPATSAHPRHANR